VLGPKSAEGGKIGRSPRRLDRPSQSLHARQDRNRRSGVAEHPPHLFRSCSGLSSPEVMVHDTDLAAIDFLDVPAFNQKKPKEYS
jgi:hypothetical protein